MSCPNQAHLLSSTTAVITSCVLRWKPDYQAHFLAIIHAPCPYACPGEHLQEHLIWHLLQGDNCIRHETNMPHQAMSHHIPPLPNILNMVSGSRDHETLFLPGYLLICQVNISPIRPADNTIMSRLQTSSDYNNTCICRSARQKKPATHMVLLEFRHKRLVYSTLTTVQCKIVQYNMYKRTTR